MAFGNQNRRAKLEELNAASQVVETARGPIEFARRGSAPYVVILHGTPGGHNQGFIGAPLEEAGFGTITPSRPGYLRTPLETGRTFEEQADAVAALLDASEVDRVAVYAISGGGPSAIQFAARHPDRVRALILEVAVSKTYKPDVSARTIAFFTSPIFTWFQGQLLKRFPRLALGQMLKIESTLTGEDRARVTANIVGTPEKLEFIHRFMESVPPFDLLRAGFDNDLEQFRAIEGLPLEEIRCPTLVAHGTHDGDVPFEHGETSAREIPGAALHRVEKGWHLLAVSDGADDYQRAQVVFLRKHLVE